MFDCSRGAKQANTPPRDVVNKLLGSKGHREMLFSRSAAVASRIRVIRRGLSNRVAGILSSLNIPDPTQIPGVYDGEWKGSGEILNSVCPTTGELIGSVCSVGFFSYLKKELF